MNLVGVKPGQLQLTGAVLADIYLGKITKWNDPALAALYQAVLARQALGATVLDGDEAVLAGLCFLHSQLFAHPQG